MVVLRVVLWCGFGHEWSPFHALPLKHKHVAAASQKKNLRLSTVPPYGMMRRQSVLSEPYSKQFSVSKYSNRFFRM